MIVLENYIRQFQSTFPGHHRLMPWDITKVLPDLIREMIERPGEDYAITADIAIHKSATVEQHVVLKGPLIIGKDCFVGANAYLRGGVYLDSSVKIGPGCEIKRSVLFSGTSTAHFNYIGDSIIGHGVNFEAGAVIANHFNERAEKKISVLSGSEIIATGSEKFGALVGDHCRIGANAVLSPGTILEPGTIVKRLELVEQVRR